MEWIILEALVALAMGFAIIWWTVSPLRRRERERELRSTDAGGSDKVREDGDGDRR